MQALGLVETWPVPHVAAAAVSTRTTATHGDVDRVFELASVTKLLTAWAVLIAAEEGSLSLDSAVGQPGCTLRHLLSHAGGYGFDDTAPTIAPGRRRVYSNIGVELAAAAVAEATGIPFATYLGEAVLDPLGMHRSELRGSPASGMRSTIGDLLRFVAELRRPTLVHTDATTVQFPELGGVVPGIGRFDPCPWGLGPELRGDKAPHWTGARNSPSTFGHFGGAGTFLWVDPAAEVACIALTDRRFDEWAPDALRLWPALSDAILDGAADERAAG